MGQSKVILLIAADAAMAVVVVMVDKRAPTQRSDYGIRRLHLSRLGSGSELILKVMMMQSQRIACEQRPQIVEQVGIPVLDDHYALEAVKIPPVVGLLGNSHMLDW